MRPHSKFKIENLKFIIPWQACLRYAGHTLRLHVRDGPEFDMMQIFFSPGRRELRRPDDGTGGVLQ
jgi:hypothetical protein